MSHKNAMKACIPLNVSQMKQVKTRHARPVERWFVYMPTTASDAYKAAGTSPPSSDNLASRSARGGAR